jgi:hypothetical protein
MWTKRTHKTTWGNETLGQTECAARDLNPEPADYETRTIPIPPVLVGMLLPPSLFEHPTAELSVDGLAQLGEDPGDLIT